MLLGCSLFPEGPSARSLVSSILKDNLTRQGLVGRQVSPGGSVLLTGPGRYTVRPLHIVAPPACGPFHFSALWTDSSERRTNSAHQTAGCLDLPPARKWPDKTSFFYKIPSLRNAVKIQNELANKVVKLQWEVGETPGRRVRCMRVAMDTGVMDSTPDRTH